MITISQQDKKCNTDKDKHDITNLFLFPQGLIYAKLVQ